ncbi:MAG: A24 family peptidase [Janthinobacterium lividum]
MLELAVLILFPLLMAYSAVSDLLTMTIANWISLLLVAAFVVVAMVAGMPVRELLTDHLACGVAVLVITFTLFAFGWIGGGDAKLAAATAVWLGWQKMIEYGFEASAIGGALTLTILVWRRYEMPPVLMRHAWIARLHLATNGVPYGIALAVTGLILYPETWVWTAVAGS